MNNFSSGGHFFDDGDIADNLFDELLNELEFENYAKNDFITAPPGIQ